MENTQMINHIKQTAANVLPKGSTLYLYGSRARGDYRAAEFGVNKKHIQI